MFFDTIENTTRKAKEWTIQHKTEIIICGGIAACIGIAAWGYKRNNIIEPIFMPIVPKTAPIMTPMPNTNTVISISEASKPAREIMRRGHIRNLPHGWKASQTKIAEALEKGIELKSGETLVSPCTVKM